MATRKTRPPLTKAKQAQGSAVHKGKPLHYSAAVEMRYSDTLTRMVRQMRETTESAFRRLDKQFATDAVGMDAPSYASQARILVDALRKRFNAAFARRSRPAAERMQAQVDAASSASLHSSLRQLSGGISLSTRSIPAPATEMLKASITENVALIRSIPEQYFLDVQGAVMRNIQRGDGTAGVLREIERVGGVATRRAELIARDQVSKATSALNAARMKGLGVRKFEWIHSGGGKEPRKLHQRMSGNVYSLDDPPVIDERTGERGLPGALVNCRCVMRPVLEYGEEIEPTPAVPVVPVAPTPRPRRRPTPAPAAPPPPVEAPTTPATLPLADVNALHDRDFTAYTLAEGRRDGKEHLRVYDAATGHAFPAVTDGKKGGVTFPPWMIAELQNPRREIVLHHNHPSSSSFSPADLRIVHEFAGAKGIWAHGHNGSSYYAEAGRRKMTLKTYNFARKWVQQWVQRQVNSGAMTPADANLTFFHIVTLLAEKQGYLTYRATLRGETEDAFNRVEPLVSKFLEGIRV